MGAELVALGGYAFIIYNNKLLSFSAHHLGTKDWDEKAPYIGKSETGPFYKFPLTEAQVIKILGEPDNIKNQ